MLKIFSIVMQEASDALQKNVKNMCRNDVKEKKQLFTEISIVNRTLVKG